MVSRFVGIARAESIAASSTRRRALLLAALTTALPLAHAQGTKWPERPVRVVVPFAPGGALKWFGMWAPPGTPKRIVDQLNQSIARILRKSDVQERLRIDGMEAAHNTPEELSRYIARDIAKWSNVVKAGNVKVD